MPTPLHPCSYSTMPEKGNTLWLLSRLASSSLFWCRLLFCSGGMLCRLWHAVSQHRRQMQESPQWAKLGRMSKIPSTCFRLKLLLVYTPTPPLHRKTLPCSFNSSTCDLRASLFISRIVSNVNPYLVFKKSAYLIAIAGKKKAYVFN